jgi:hypothetical protein
MVPVYGGKCGSDGPASVPPQKAKVIDAGGESAAVIS